MLSAQPQDTQQSKNMLDIHHSYDYLAVADLQSLQCFQRQASTRCDLGPSGGSKETGYWV